MLGCAPASSSVLSPLSLILRRSSSVLPTSGACPLVAHRPSFRPPSLVLSSLVRLAPSLPVLPPSLPVLPPSSPVLPPSSPVLRRLSSVAHPTIISNDMLHHIHQDGCAHGGIQLTQNILQPEEDGWYVQFPVVACCSPSAMFHLSVYGSPMTMCHNLAGICSPCGPSMMRMTWSTAIVTIGQLLVLAPAQFKQCCE